MFTRFLSTGVASFRATHIHVRVGGPALQESPAVLKQLEVIHCSTCMCHFLESLILLGPYKNLSYRQKYNFCTPIAIPGGTFLNCNIVS